MLLDLLFKTLSPNWDFYQQLKLIVFSTEVRERIWKAAEDQVKLDIGELNETGTVVHIMPQHLTS